MKKLVVLILIIFMITGCTVKSEHDNPENPEDVDEVDLYAANYGREFTNWEKFAEDEKGAITILAGKDQENLDFSNYLLGDLNVGYTPTFILIDTEGKIRYFNDGVISTEDFDSLIESIPEEIILCFEVVATTCSHCKKQMSEYMPSIVTNYPDMVFVEYFITDTIEDVKEFYELES